MTDTPQKLNLVSPCRIDQEWDGSIFAELEVKFLEKVVFNILIQLLFVRHHSATLP